jgi:hypothetical protein
MHDAGRNNGSKGTPHETARLEELKRIFAGPAATLSEAQSYAGDRVRETTKNSFGRLIDAHLLISGVLAGVLLRTDGKRSEYGDDHQERRVLFASFVVGIPLCERAIEEGRYLQALALLRQEMETVAQIIKSHARTREKGKTATVALLGKDIARAYGDLSAAAHASSHDMASGLLTE